LGVITIGLWGIIFRPFLGALIGEIIGGREHTQALKIAVGTLVGVIVGNLLKITVVLVMIGFLVVSWFR
jgi:uncharacterized protein